MTVAPGKAFAGVSAWAPTVIVVERSIATTNRAPRNAGTNAGPDAE
jgi:hypothetical protein